MRKPRLRSVLSLSVALAAATTMGASAPQVAAAGGAFCDPQVDAQVQAGGVVAARGGTVREPDTGQVHQDLPKSAKGEGGPELHGDRAGLLPHRH